MGRIEILEWKGPGGEFKKSITGDTQFVAPNDSGHFPWLLRVTDDDGVRSETTFVLTVKYHEDASLDELSVIGIPLTPIFNNTQYNYSGFVPFDQDSVNLQIKATEGHATLVFGEKNISIGNLTQKIPLEVGGNLFSISVIAQNQIGKKNYSLALTRRKNNNAKLADLRITPGTLFPSFNSDSLFYHVTLPLGKNSVMFTPFASDSSRAKVKVNGIQRISGTNGEPVLFVVGLDTVSITVTAQDDSTTKIYRVIVNRQPSVEMTLKSIETTAGKLSPLFTADVLLYTDTVSNAVVGIALKPTATSNLAQLFLNGISISSGSLTDQLGLLVGDNLINIKVKAESGDSVFYKIQIHRKSESTELAQLLVSSGEVRPKLSKTITTYMDTVSSHTESALVTLSSVNPLVQSISIGDSILSGAYATRNFGIKVGANIIPIRVTSEDGNFKMDTLIIYRKNPDATLISLETDGGSVSPIFSSATKEYSLNIVNVSKSISFKPTATSDRSTIYINSVRVTSGAFSNLYNVNVGDTKFNFLVISEGGDSLHYNLILHRRSINADLLDLRIDQGVLSPIFNSSNLKYDLLLGAGVKSVWVTARSFERNISSITIQNKVVTGDSARIEIPVGAITSPEKIRIVVKSEDGNEKIYSIVIQGPGFIRMIGGSKDDFGGGVIEASDGSYMSVGTIGNPDGTVSMAVTKLSNLGDTVWVRSFRQNAYGLSIAETQDKGFFVLGYDKQAIGGGTKAFYMKIDSDGTIFWTKTYGSLETQYPQRLITTKDGGLLFCGQIIGADHNYGFIIKSNSNGDTLWTKKIGVGTDFFGLYSVKETNGDSLVFVGSSGSPNKGEANIMVMKTDAVGNIRWKKTYGTIGFIFGNDLETIKDGGYLICGSSVSLSSPQNITFLKVSQSGDSLWTKLVSSLNTEDAATIRQTSDGGYFTTGFRISTGETKLDIEYSKFSSDLNLEWVKTYQTGLPQNEFGMGTEGLQSKNGGFLISGTTNFGLNGKKDWIIIKTDKNGNHE